MIPDIILDILHDAVFAALAGIGFGAISNPPKRAFIYIAILAATGHAFRFILMEKLGVDIATASLFGALVIGFGSLWFGARTHCPMTIFSIPALLPMIPGKIAYSAIFSLIMFLQTSEDVIVQESYLNLFHTNILIALTVVSFLGVGSIIPMFLFSKKAFSLTRKKKEL